VQHDGNEIVTNATIAHDGLGRFRPARKEVRRLALHQLLLRVALFLALLRSTSMWVGYPSSQSDLSTISPLHQQLMLYSLLPVMGLYVAIDYRFVLLALKRVRPALVIMLILILASVAFSMDKRASLRGFVAVATISAPVVFHTLRYGAAETYRMVVYFCVAAIYINALFTVARPGTAIMTGALAGSVRGMFIHKNDFAQFVAVALVFVATVPRSTRMTWLQLHRVCATVLALGLLVASRSASGVVLVATACLAFVCIRFINRTRGAGVRLYLTGVLVAVTAAAVYVVFVLLLDAILSGLGRDPTLTGRTGLWRVLYRVSLEDPWFGHGFAMFKQPETMAQYHSEFGWAARSTHNTYLELALNMGYPSTALVVIFLLRELLQRIARLRDVGVYRDIYVRQSLAILMVLIGGMTVSALLLAPTASWVILLSCLGPLGPLVKPPPRRRLGHSGYRTGRLGNGIAA
jgi:O-antigen ligase